MPGRIFLVWCALVISLCNPVQARTFLLGPEEAPGGELGSLFGGAQTALAGGTEGLFSNPAGLAGDPRGQFSAGVGPLGFISLDVGGVSNGGFNGGGGYLAWSDRLGSGRGPVVPAYGLLVRRHPDQALEFRLTDSRNRTGEVLPYLLAGALDVDAMFPGGIAIRESSRGISRVSRTGLGAGLGVALGNWLRLGCQLELEWLEVSTAGWMFLDYAAHETSGTGVENVLQGQSSGFMHWQGASNRLIFSGGMQIQGESGLGMGLYVRLPSDTLSGTGSLNMFRGDWLAVSSDGSAVHDQTAYSRAGGEKLPFRLDSPRQVRLGFSLKSDWAVITLDLTRTAPQAGYEVLPGVQGTGSLLGVSRLDSLETSGRGALDYALGMAFVGGGGNTLVMGLRSRRALAPPDDPVFRALDFTSVSTGVYHHRKGLSASLGLGYRFGETRSMRFSAPGGYAQEELQQPVRMEEWSLSLGATLAY